MDNKIIRNVRRRAQRFGRVQGVDLEIFYFGVVLKLKSFLTFTGGNANVVLPDARPMVKLIGNMHGNEPTGMLRNQNRSQQAIGLLNQDFQKLKCTPTFLFHL